MPILPILVAVDVDPDWRSEGGGKPYEGRLGWEGVKIGLPRLLQLVKDIRDGFGQSVRFTWLLRSDAQMAELTGDAAYVAETFNEFWRSRLGKGDEIGWHPHAWRFSERHSLWYQENSDVDWLRECLRDGFRALSRHFLPTVGKPGWTAHNNATIGIFADLGIRTDLSALPGMRYGTSIPGTSLPLGVYDWSRSPQEPYYPSREDYQRPDDGQSLPILEVPNWVFPLSLPRRIHHLARHRSARDFANPAKKPFLARGGFVAPPLTVPFVCYFHPEELLGRTPVFKAENVVVNLSRIIRACALRGLRPRMTVASELDKLIRVSA